MLKESDVSIAGIMYDLEVQQQGSDPSDPTLAKVKC